MVEAHPVGGGEEAHLVARAAVRSAGEHSAVLVASHAKKHPAETCSAAEVCPVERYSAEELPVEGGLGEWFVQLRLAAQRWAELHS